MWKTKILLIFFAVSLLSGQSRRGSNATAIQEGYLLTSLSGYGISGSVRTTITGLGISNPALASDLKGFSVGISMQNSSVFDNYIVEDYTFKNGINIPQSFEILFPVHRFRIGLGYNHIYDSIAISGPIQVVTLGGETDGYFRAKTITHILSKSAQISWSELKGVSTGIRINQYTLISKDQIYNSVYNSQGNKYSYDFGLLYKSFDQRIRFGVSYSNGVSIVGNYTSLNDSLGLPPDSLIVDIIGTIQDIAKIAFIPSRLEFGTSYKFNPRFVVLGQISYTEAKSTDQTLKNRMEISINVKSQINDHFVVTTGYLNQSISYKSENYIFHSINFGNHYFVVSPILNFGKIGLEYSLVLANKQVDKKRTQIINKLGLNWKF